MSSCCPTPKIILGGFSLITLPSECPPPLPHSILMPSSLCLLGPSSLDALLPWASFFKHSLLVISSLSIFASCALLPCSATSSLRILLSGALFPLPRCAFLPTLFLRALLPSPTPSISPYSIIVLSSLVIPSVCRLPSSSVCPSPSPMCPRYLSHSLLMPHPFPYSLLAPSLLTSRDNCPHPPLMIIRLMAHLPRAGHVETDIAFDRGNELLAHRERFVRHVKHVMARQASLREQLEGELRGAQAMTASHVEAIAKLKRQVQPLREP